MNDSKKEIIKYTLFTGQTALISQIYTSKVSTTFKPHSWAMLVKGNPLFVSLPVSISAPLSKQIKVSMNRSARPKDQVLETPGEELERMGHGEVWAQQDRKDTACS